MQDLTSRKRQKETPVTPQRSLWSCEKNVEFRLKSRVVSLSPSLPLSLSIYLSIYLSTWYLSLSLSLALSLSLCLSLSLSRASLSLSVSLSLCLVNRCWVLLTPCSVPVDVLCLLVLVSVGSVNPCVYMLWIDCWLSCVFYKASMKSAPLGLAGVGSEVKPRKHFRRWRSYDPTNSLRTPTMRESQLLRERKHFLGLCFNMFKRCAYPVSLTCIHTCTQQQAMCRPWAYLKKASGSWLLFQIERAWSPRWVENDTSWRRSGELRSSNVVQKPVFLISSSRPSERHAVAWHRGVDLFVIYRGRLCDLPPMSGHGLDGRACLWNTEVFALLLGNVLDVREWLNDILAS